MGYGGKSSLHNVGEIATPSHLPRNTSPKSPLQLYVAMALNLGQRNE